MIAAPRRRPGALAAALLTLFLLGLTGTGLGATASAATDSGSIDHAQPTQDGVRLLVSAPSASGPVDLTGVKVEIGGHAVKSQAVAASSSNEIKRVAILAIDTSDSMHGARIAEAKRAATTYLGSAPANVEIGVLTFDDKVRLLVKPTLDRDAARAAIGKLTLTRNTALYDGVLGAIEATGPGGDDAGQRRVLVLSDGKDTTQTDLSDVLDTISGSGVLVDAVALQQSGTESQPLRDMVAAGKGKVLDASSPTALSAAFAQEAEVLSRQIVVTADVPASAHKNADVSVTMPVDGQDVTATAYLPVRTATPATAAATVPAAVRAGGLQVSERVVLGGVIAIAVGLLGVIVALWSSKPSLDAEDRHQRADARLRHPRRLRRREPGPGARPPASPGRRAASPSAPWPTTAASRRVWPPSSRPPGCRSSRRSGCCCAPAWPSPSACSACWSAPATSCSA